MAPIHISTYELILKDAMSIDIQKFMSDSYMLFANVMFTLAFIRKYKDIFS
jgi:hypothetical protein